VNVWASQLNVRISADQAKDWANDSHALAAKVAYADVPADGPPPKLGLP
jgi:hypothetical protein